MFAINEHFSKISSNGFENVLRIAQITLDGSEQLLKYQLEISKQALEDNAALVGKLSAGTDPQQLFGQWTQLYGSAFDKALNNARGAYEIIARTGGEYRAASEDALEAWHKSLTEAFDQFARDNAGNNEALAAIKSSFAAVATTIDSLTRATQQFAELAGAAKAPAKQTAKQGSKSQA